MIIFVLGTLVPMCMIAQKPKGVGSGGFIPQSKLDSLKRLQDNTSDTLTVDTTIYKYVHINDIFHKIEFSDSSANIKFLHQYGLSHQGEYVNTGNFGSAVQSIIYAPDVNIGFNHGYNQYRYYQIRPDNFKFYEQNRPLSDVFFTQIGGQDNIQVGANFSRNFTKGLSISLNYRRISQKGFYSSQEVRTTALGLGLRYQSPNDKFNAIVLFTHNANNENHNGGITNDSFLTEKFKKAVPTILSEASTRQQERNITFTQYYKLNKTQNKIWNLFIRNVFQYSPSYFKYSDKNVPDSINQAYYFGLNNDIRGLRRYVGVTQLSDGFFIHGEKVNGIKGYTGIIYNQINIENTPKNENRTDVTLVGEGKLPFLKAFEILAKGQIGLLANLGNFDFSGSMMVNISKEVILDGGVRLFRSEANYNATQLHINNAIIADTTFSKPFGTVLFAAINIPKLKFSISLHQNVISNPIFWPVTGLASQYNGIYTMTYIKASQNLKLGSIHLDNTGYLQLQNSGLYPIPKLFSTHQLYYNGKWFKKVMDISIGLDTRMITAYNAATYQPLFGSYLTSNTSLPFVPASNLFIMFSVSSFRAIFMMENFSKYIVKEDNFDILKYPQFEPKFRMGFRWLLKD